MFPIKAERDEDTGLKAPVTVTTDDDGNTANEEGYTMGNPLNLKNPDAINHYVITSPDGKAIIDEGTLDGKVIESLDDIGVSGNQLTADSVYVKFSSEVGTTNSADDDSITKENGYLIVENGKLVKVIPTSDLIGDVDLNGVVDVRDIIMLQKYLHNLQSFNIENFINADTTRNGWVDVFDLAMLKRILTKSK